MLRFGELAGMVIVAAAVAQALSMFMFSALRRARSLRGQRLALDLFREQARVHLDAARAERARVEQGWDGVRKFVVERRVDEADGVASFELRPHDRRPLPVFRPGQHLRFALRIPDQRAPVVRCYSLSDTPLERGHYRITVKRIERHADGSPGCASCYLFEHVREGEILDVHAPSGQFFLDLEDDRPVVLLAGGVGITPLYSMLATLARMGSRREAWLFYGVRHSHDHALADKIHELTESHQNLHVVTCYSNPLPEDLDFQPYDEQGRITLDVLRRHLPSNNFLYYLCGPPAMMSSLTESLLEWGVPKSDIHFEAFGAASARASLGSEQAEPCEVVFARSGKICTWSPTIGTLLDLAEREGVPLPSGCRAGSCGSCVTAVKSGEVRNTIIPGAPAAEGSCLACVAVPRTRLVLDA